MRWIGTLAIALAMDHSAARADIITYEWNDDYTGSAFAGSFTVDTARLQDIGGPGRLLTPDAIVASGFQFSRASFGNPVSFGILDVSAGGIAIDPVTGAVLSDGELIFGPSNGILVGGSPYQVLGGRVQLDRSFDVSFGAGAGGAESALVTDTSRPDEYLMSSGHWDVDVVPVDVPAPPAAVLGLLAIGCGAAWRRNRSG